MIRSLPCIHFEKKMTPLKQQITLLAWPPTIPLPLTRIRTLLMESNLKMLTILFALRYIRYKGRVKSQIWDSKVYPWLPRQMKHQLLRRIHLFFFHFFLCIFLCFLKWNFRCTFKCNIAFLLKFIFIELFCEYSRINKCATICIFNCNSIVTSRAPSVSTSNVGLPWDKPSAAPLTSLSFSCLSETSSSKTSSASSLSLYFAYSVAFKEYCKVPVQIQH